MIRNEDWSTMRRLLFMRGAAGGALKEYEAEGNPVAFNTNVAKPLSAFTIPFLPVQYGTGDPSPDNVRPITGWSGAKVTRSGKNLLNPVLFGTANSRYLKYETGETISWSSAYRTSDYVPVIAGFQYTLHAVMWGQNTAGTAFYDSEKQYISGFQMNSKTKTDYTFTAPEGAAYMRFCGTDDIIGFDDVFLVFGDTAGTFEEYVTPQTVSVTFPALGNNMFNIDTGVTGGINSYGQETTTSDNFRSDFIQIEPDQAYTLSATGTNVIRMYWFDSEKEFISPRSEATSSQMTKTAPSNARFIRVVAAKYGVTMDKETATACNIMLNKGGTALPYEPYMNTVYGGTLDAVAGVLSVEWAKKNVSDITFTLSAGGGFGFVIERASGNPVYSNILNMRSNANTGIADLGIADVLYHPNSTSAYRDYFYARNPEYDTISAFSEWFKTTYADGYFVYELATPLEIPLSPLSIQTLTGDNTIWTDTNGSNTIKYKKKG